MTTEGATGYGTRGRFCGFVRWEERGLSNHMRCIGFDVQTEDEFLELAQRSVVEGKRLAAGEHSYLFVWRIGDGVEL